MSELLRYKAIELITNFKVGRTVKQIEIGDFSDLKNMFEFGEDGLIFKDNNELSNILENFTSIKYTIIDEKINYNEP